ncbi:MAG: hypothetical protein I8H71_14225 [Xanthomonadaceae bacterium]|nr:hypothetical protein [Xanthomonadaceae bacterium]
MTQHQQPCARDGCCCPPKHGCKDDSLTFDDDHADTIARHGERKGRTSPIDRKKRSALQALHNLTDQHRLCYGALGREKLAPGRACFRVILHQ